MSYGRRSLIQTPPVCSTTGSTTRFLPRPTSSARISGSNCAAGPVKAVSRRGAPEGRPRARSNRIDHKLMSPPLSEVK